MKLYLSSSFFGKNARELTQLVSSNRKVAIIMNAGDSYDDANRRKYFNAEAQKFTQLGFDAAELDLRDYFSSNAGLEDTLKNYGLVWLMGGNTFVLRRALKQSRAEVLLKKLVSKNQLVYAGFSAGAVVATPTLRGIELVDDPNEVPAGYTSEIIWDGLGFTGFSIAPHFQSAGPEAARINEVITYFETQNMPYKALSDGEDLVISTPAA